MTKMHIVIVAAIGLICPAARGGITEFTFLEFSGQSTGEVDGLRTKETTPKPIFGPFFASGETGGSILDGIVIGQSFAEFSAALTFNLHTTVIDVSGSGFAFIVDGSVGNLESSTSIDLRFSLSEATSFLLNETGEDFFGLSGDSMFGNPGSIDFENMTMTAGDYLISGGPTVEADGIGPLMVERSGRFVLTIPSPGGAALLACAGLAGRRRRRH